MSDFDVEIGALATRDLHLRQPAFKEPRVDSRFSEDSNNCVSLFAIVAVMNIYVNWPQLH